MHQVEPPQRCDQQQHQQDGQGAARQAARAQRFSGFPSRGRGLRCGEGRGLRCVVFCGCCVGCGIAGGFAGAPGREAARRDRRRQLGRCGRGASRGGAQRNGGTVRVRGAAGGVPRRGRRVPLWVGCGVPRRGRGELCVLRVSRRSRTRHVMGLKCGGQSHCCPASGSEYLGVSALLESSKPVLAESATLALSPVGDCETCGELEGVASTRLPFRS